MRVVFLCPRFLSARGGAELHAWQLAKGLTDRGHDVTIMASALLEEEKENSIGRDERIPIRTMPRKPALERVARRILRLEERRGLYRFVQHLRKAGWLDIISNGPYCPAVAKTEPFSGYDLAVLMGFNTCWEVLFARAAKRLDTPVPVAIPLLHPREPTAQLPIHRRCGVFFRHTVAKTHFEKNFLVNHGWNAEMISVSGVASDPWPSSVSAELFRMKCGLPMDAPIVLFMGRKVFNKGASHLIQAMDGVWDHHSNARLVLLGFSHNPPEWLDGYLGRCRHDARGMTVNLDDIDDAMREHALSACTVMALPSISDSFGIAYLDAWRHGKPVIGCRNTCAESFIEPSVNGDLVEFGDVQALAGAISSLLDHPEQAAAMGRRGYEKWNAYFRTPAITDEMETCFRQLLDQP